MAADKTYSGKVKLDEKKSEKKIARAFIEVEFEIDSADVVDIIATCRNAMEELNSLGYVTKAKLNVPSTEMDLT